MLLWPGGIWNWFDPLTVIDAVAELARTRDDVRLVFLGLQHPNPHVPAMAMAAAAVARAEELGLRDRVVFFNEGWVPYEERGAYLLEADVGVSAHFDDLESRFAFRTRLLDCFWAGLPVVTTRGDALGDLVERARPRSRRRAAGRRRAGSPPSSRCSTTTTRVRRARASRHVRDEFLWPRVVEPLRRLVREPGRPVRDTADDSRAGRAGSAGACVTPSPTAAPSARLGERRAACRRERCGSGRYATRP